MYGIGDYIVKYSDGVCRVDDITHLNMSGVDKNKLYYLLIPVEDNRRKVYVPVDTTDTTIRRAMTEEEALNLIDEIPKIEKKWSDNEKEREHQYKEAAKTCNPKALIAIIKTTYTRNMKRAAAGKKKTLVDERYFKMAQNNLYMELGFALHREKNSVEQLIRESVKNNSEQAVL
jgi:CarD family transcriptional regulator